MNSTIAIILLISWGAISLSASAFVPGLFSDKNVFLKGFITHEFVSFMGVLVTITLASAANLYVELNKLEERRPGVIFKASKKHVRDSAYALIGSLVVSLIVVVTKPWIGVWEHVQSLFNCFALGVIGFAVMILIDLTQAAFDLDPKEIPGPELPKDPTS